MKVADDIKLAGIVKTEEDQNVTREKLTGLEDWSDSNGMKINSSE